MDHASQIATEKEKGIDHPYRLGTLEGIGFKIRKVSRTQCYAVKAISKITANYKHLI